MLDLNGLDIDELAMAVADQTDYEHRWLIDPRTGQSVIWTSDTGFDGERLARTLHGQGAFRRFKNQVYNHPDLISPWQALRDARARRRAVECLLDQELINQKPLRNTNPGQPRAGRDGRVFFEPHPVARASQVAAATALYGSMSCWPLSMS